jgi:hypothetical protein
MAASRRVGWGCKGLVRLGAPTKAGKITTGAAVLLTGRRIAPLLRKSA